MFITLERKAAVTKAARAAKTTNNTQLEASQGAKLHNTEFSDFVRLDSTSFYCHQSHPIVNLGRQPAVENNNTSCL